MEAEEEKVTRQRGRYDVHNFEEMKKLQDGYGSFKTWVDANGEEHQYRSTVYVDNWDTVCRHYSVTCDQYVEDGIMYRCILCHANEMDIYCKATTQQGRRCKSVVASYSRDPKEWEASREDWRRRMNLEEGTRPGDEFCHHHSREAVRKGTRFSIDMLEEWLDGWQRETILRWKKSVLKDLEVLGRLTVEELRARAEAEPNAYVYFIKCGKYVKIGTSRNPQARFKTLRSENNSTIRPKGINIADAELIGYFPGGRDLESLLHWTLREEQAAGEWFRLGPSTSKLMEKYLKKDEFTVTGVVDSIIRDYDVILGVPETTKRNRIDISTSYGADTEIRRLRRLERISED
jgi:hypothetical protein